MDTSLRGHWPQRQNVLVAWRQPEVLRREVLKPRRLCSDQSLLQKGQETTTGTESPNAKRSLTVDKANSTLRIPEAHRMENSRSPTEHLGPAAFSTHSGSLSWRKPFPRELWWHLCVTLSPLLGSPTAARTTAVRTSCVGTKDFHGDMETC